MGRFNSEQVKALAIEIAKKAGVPEEDAVIFSDSLIEADIQGTSTHGISRLNIYIRRIQSGVINPRAEITIERKRNAVMSVDAGNGLGQVQASKTLDILIPMAKAGGIASATIRNSQHFGALSYYCNRAALNDMILLATTNAEPAMAPEGSYQAYFGTNPLAVSFPTGKRCHPVKIDLSTSLVSRGNIIAAHKKGENIPLGWALDAEGNPTTDPERALMGTVLSMAGHKGYALAFLAEVFSGVLSGAAFGSLVGSMYKNMTGIQNVGHFFCLLDIDAFMDVPVFKMRIDTMITQIKSSHRRPGVEEVLIPGDRSFRSAEENRKKGIEIGNETLRELKTLCEELSIPFNLPRSSRDHCEEPD